MPFKSEAQRRFMYAKHPQIAKRWSNEYGNPTNLPEHKDKSMEKHKMKGGMMMSDAEMKKKMAGKKMMEKPSMDMQMMALKKKKA